MGIYKFVIAVAVIVLGNSCSSKKGITSKSKCDLIPDKGNCRAMISKYYFDKEEGKCKEFFWGGCDGVVPFETLDECTACKCNN